MAGRTRAGKKRNDRDLDRLAFLERLNRGEAAAAGGTPRSGTPAMTGRVPAIARYARFRQVASLLFALALLAILWGLVAMVLTVAAILRAEMPFLAGAGRLVTWAFATTAGYGVLKGLGEALLLWADVAELNNTAVEIAWQGREEEARRQ